GRGDVGAAHPDVGRVEEGPGEVAEPVRVRVRIVVDVGDDLARGRPEPEVPGPTQPAVRAADQPEAVLAGNGGRGVARAVVDDDHLEVRVLEPPQAFEALAAGPGAVGAADDPRA